MWLLVDYGNIPAIDKKRGVPHVIDDLINRIGPRHLKANERVHIRLYDGWYEGHTLSKHAQQIAAEIESFSPSPMLVRNRDLSFLVRANFQLARSLISDPAKDILHTYRIRGFPSGLLCKPPPYPGCANVSDCPLRALHTFFDKRRCPGTGCSLHPKTIISRAEQKVVDTMMTADLVELSLRGETIAIASSDDDIWPGISLSLSRGGTVIHIQTKVGKSTPIYYTENLPARYVQIEAR